MCLREPSRELATNSCSRYFYKHLLGAWYRAWSRDTEIAKQTWLDDLFIPTSPHRKHIHKYDTLPFREYTFKSDFLPLVWQKVQLCTRAKLHNLSIKKIYIYFGL